MSFERLSVLLAYAKTVHRLVKRFIFIDNKYDIYKIGYLWNALFDGLIKLELKFVSVVFLTI